MQTSSLTRPFLAAAVILGFVQLHCAGPGPRVFPEPVGQARTLADGWQHTVYDTNRDGTLDYAECASPTGRITQLRFGPAALRVDESKWETGEPEGAHADPAAAAANANADVVSLDGIPSGECRQLVIILDSVPYGIVRDLYDLGYFRLFYPPARGISPFPVMTDPSLCRLFGLACPAVEAEFFDGHELRHGADVYPYGANAPWYRFTDYRLLPLAHALAYTDQYPWFGHELKRIQDRFLAGDKKVFVGYCVGTSSIGTSYGAAGHQNAMLLVEKLCQQIVYDLRGRVRITLLSDHGHYLSPSRRVNVDQFLTDRGYRLSTELNDPGDVVLPSFGLVSCVSLQTENPAKVAAELTGLDGVELAIYREQDRVVVLSRGGRAEIAARDDRLRYSAVEGDPISYLSIVDRLTASGHIDADGFASADDWFQATSDRDYPDAVSRLWHAFDGQFEHTPDIYLSLANGRHFGSRKMETLMQISGIHGNLHLPSTCGFIMTMAGPLPEVIRMQHIREALYRAGVPLPGANSLPEVAALAPQ